MIQLGTAGRSAPRVVPLLGAALLAGLDQGIKQVVLETHPDIPVIPRLGPQSRRAAEARSPGGLDHPPATHP